MRTTVDLPVHLLEDAQRLAGCATRRETVVTALEELIRGRRRLRLLGMLGNTDVKLTADDIREMRRDREPPEADEPLVLILPSDGRHRS